MAQMLLGAAEGLGVRNWMCVVVAQERKKKKGLIMEL